MGNAKDGKPGGGDSPGAKRKDRRQVRGRMQPPLTPMIDVTFLLLIYFVLTMAFRQSEAQLPGNLPKGGGSPPPATVRVVVTPRGAANELAQYALRETGGRYDTPGELFAALEGARQAFGDTRQVQLLIEPRPDVRWTWVADAYNQAVRARYENVGFSPSYE